MISQVPQVEHRSINRCQDHCEGGMNESERKKLMDLVKRWRRQANKSMKAASDETLPAACRDRFFGEANEVRICSNELNAALKSMSPSAACRD